MTLKNQRRNPEELIGKHLVYTYDNGWQYEIYVKNDHTFSYRIHGGIVAGRWVRDQEANIVQIADRVFKISWDEPTGTVVCVTVNLVRKELHGAIFLPQWIKQNPEKTVCYQNEHLPLMYQYRDRGPTYPKMVICEFATITFVEDCGADRDDIIDCPPDKLPANFPDRTKNSVLV
ncbi:MAG: phenolic acid decarboxylase [Pleurocapsa sp. MO_226.B13]|nr:phenolic acid decarboxylase [Pleurocapsa sp. MO_226.B13]